MIKLFTPFSLRGLVFKNRIFISPMCQYSAENGVPNDWHMVHLGARAVGGAACVIVEASAVTPDGRISPADIGMWNDAQMQAFQPITRFIESQGCVPAIQLAHAGRKASTAPPWQGGQPVSPAEGGWSPLVAPSAIAFNELSQVPHALSVNEIQELVMAFATAARRSLNAGFRMVELHGAHGYLLHEFLSPLSNHRTDDYGGSLENRARFPLLVAQAVRDVWPSDLPVIMRISATDWVEGGWDLDQSILFSRWLKEIGIDLVDCSTGGLVPNAVIPAGPGFQVPFAKAIRRQVGIATGAVGFITAGPQAEMIVRNDEADVVLLARESLRDPYWPLHAAYYLGANVPWPKQYERAKPQS